MRSTESPAAATVPSQAIEAIRRFNRLYTRRLGLLDRGLLGSEFSLTEARVLYELAQRDNCTATEIARVLGLDLGYLSRLLAKFERRRALKRTRSTVDARQSLLQLTKQGRAIYRQLDRAAQDQVAGLIGPLSAEQRAELLGAMRSLGQIFEPSGHREVYTVRRARLEDLRIITRRQGALYAQEYGWDSSYEALVAEILGNFARNFDPDAENAWVAERAGALIGSVFLVRASDTLAKLRLLYVEPSARGLGVGSRLVNECIAFARSKGYRTLTLWTNDVLISARRIYQAAGFELTKEERHHSFGKDLVGQTWELSLADSRRRGPP